MASTRTAKAKGATAVSSKVTEEDVEELLTSKEEVIKAGRHELRVTGNAAKAKTVVTSEDGAVILEKEVIPTVFPEVAKYKPELGAFDAAKLKAIAAYHDAVKPVTGLIDVSLLAHHPYNSAIYGEEPVDLNLVEELMRPDGRIDEISINEKGWIVSGNQRVRAAKEANKRLIEKGELPRYEFVQAEVVSFSSIEGELRYLLRKNQYRAKTKAQVVKELQGKIALAESDATPVSDRQTTEELIEEIGTALKVGRTAAFDAKAALKEAVLIEDPELKKEVEGLIDAAPTKARKALKADAPTGVDLTDYRRKLVEKIKANPKDSVEKVQADLARELAPPSSEGSESDSVLDRLKALKATPSDERKTPKEIVNLATEVMGTIHFDCFAMATDPDWVGATVKSYTIFDDGFEQKLEGNIFANPPYSKCALAIAYLKSQICSGSVAKAFLVLPSSVLSGKQFHDLLQATEALVFLPNKRLAFEPGDYLLKEVPTATADGNREPSVIVFWSLDKSDYDQFNKLSATLGWAMKRQPMFNPYEVYSKINELCWSEDNYLDFLGQKLSIEYDKGSNSFSAEIGETKINSLPSLTSARQVAIMEAIAAFRL